MMLRPALVTAPADIPVTLTEAKAWMWVDHSSHDTLITSMLAGAVAHLDGYTGILGRCIINQTWRVDLPDWPADGDIRLPFPDVSSVMVKYSDTNDAEQTVSAALYETMQDHRGSFVRFKEGFTSPGVYDDRTDAVRVTLVAGFGAAAANVPEAVKTAIKMLAAHWYANREAVGVAMQEVPLGVTALLAPYRRIGV